MVKNFIMPRSAVVIDPDYLKHDPGHFHPERPERLKILLDGIGEIIAAHSPQQAAVEKVFVNVNPQSTLLLGQARGAAISALVLAGLPVAEYTALQVKQAVVGHGKAAKEQVQQMVMRLLKLPGAPSADAADALACAICTAHHLPATFRKKGAA